MKCEKCGKGEMRQETEDRPFADLPGVILRDAAVMVCQAPKCGARLPATQHTTGLHQAIAAALVAKPCRLTSVEWRWLRDAMGLTGRDLAGLLGATPESLSRWENGKDQPGAMADRLVRLVAAGMLGASVDVKALAEITDEVSSLWEDLRHGPTGWAKATAVPAWDGAPDEERDAVLAKLAKMGTTAANAAHAILRGWR